MSERRFPKALKTSYGGEAAKGRANRTLDPDKPRYEGPFKKRLFDNKRPQQALHIYHLRQTAADEEIKHELKKAGNLDEYDDFFFRRLNDPQFALAVFPDVESARSAKRRLEHQFFRWTLRKELPKAGAGFIENKAVTGLKLDFITKSKALEIQRLDEEGKADADQGPAKSDNAGARADQKAGTSKDVRDSVGHFRVDAIKAALNLPKLGNDAALSMTAASSLFVEELLARAANEAKRDGSSEVKPEHLQRVAAYVMLHF